MSSKCKSCGHTFKQDESKCPYCGSSNPNFTKKVNANDYIRRAESVFPDNSTWNGNKSNFSENINKESEVNVCLLIFLIVVFWPAAIIYAMIKSGK